MLQVLLPFLGSWNVFLLGLVALLTLLYWRGTKNFDYWRKQGIQGPPAFPFLGNVLSLFKPIPLLHSEYLARYGKVFGAFQLSRPSLFVCDPVLIKRVLVQDFNNFRNRADNQQSRSKIMEKNLVVARDESWKRIRSIVSPTFTSSKLKKMEHLMKGCSSQMLAALEKVADSNQPIIWANEKMGNFTMDVIAKCAFATDANASNSDVASDNQFIHNARASFNFTLYGAVARLLIPRRLLQFLQKIKFPGVFQGGGKFFEDMARHMIQERREAKKKGIEGRYDDMLQLMINAEHDDQTNAQPDADDKFDEHHVNQGKEELEKEKALFQNITGTKFLTETEILAQAIVFFLAGYETTAATLSYCIYALVTNPEVQARLYQEVKEAAADDPSLSYNTVMKLPYLDAVLSETLRMYPPAMSINREAMTDYHIPEYNVTVEKGHGVVIPIRAMHYCPEYFPEPERFRPDRFLPENREREVIPYTYLPFGGGPRNCVGMRFALAEAKLGLAEMVSRFEFKPCPQTPSKLDPLLSFVLFKTHPVMVSVQRR